jgi:transposase
MIMDKKQSQKFSPELKAQVAMAALNGQMTVPEIMKKYGVSKTAVYAWKQELQQNAASLFGGAASSSSQADSASHQKQIDNLHRKIGELEMELDFARRASVALGIEMPAKN